MSSEKKTTHSSSTAGVSRNLIVGLFVCLFYLKVVSYPLAECKCWHLIMLLERSWVSGSNKCLCNIKDNVLTLTNSIDSQLKFWGVTYATNWLLCVLSDLAYGVKRSPIWGLSPSSISHVSNMSWSCFHWVSWVADGLHCIKIDIALYL